jgi:hypothetical protein
MPLKMQRMAVDGQLRGHGVCEREASSKTEHTRSVVRVNKQWRPEGRQGSVEVKPVAEQGICTVVFWQ